MRGPRRCPEQKGLRSRESVIAPAFAAMALEPRPAFDAPAPLRPMPPGAITPITTDADGSDANGAADAHDTPSRTPRRGSVRVASGSAPIVALIDTRDRRLYAAIRRQPARPARTSSTSTAVSDGLAALSGPRSATPARRSASVLILRARQRSSITRGRRIARCRRRSGEAAGVMRRSPGAEALSPDADSADLRLLGGRRRRTASGFSACAFELTGADARRQRRMPQAALTTGAGDWTARSRERRHPEHYDRGPLDGFSGPPVADLDHRQHARHAHGRRGRHADHHRPDALADGAIRRSARRDHRRQQHVLLHRLDGDGRQQRLG